MKICTLDELIATAVGADGTVEDKKQNAVTVDRLKFWAQCESCTGIVHYRNEAFDSSSFGMQSYVRCGPVNTLHTPEEAETKMKWLNDLPSQRQYAIGYWRREQPKDQLNGQESHTSRDA